MMKQLIHVTLVLVGLLSISCYGAYKDVAWLIDSSSSVSAADYQRVVDFIYNVTSYLTIGSNDIKMTVATFDVEVRAEFDLDDYSTKSALLSKIINIPKPSNQKAQRKTMDAITYVNTLFLSIKGGRNGADKAVIVVLSGTSTDTTATINAANSVRSSNGAEIFAIGIGENLTSTNTELKGIANDPDSYYLEYIGDFVNLCGVIPSIVPKLDNESSASLLDGCLHWEEPTTPFQTTEESTTTEPAVVAKINTGVNAGTVVGVILACLFILALLGLLLYFLYRRKKRKEKKEKDDKEIGDKRVAEAVKNYNDAGLGEKRYMYKRDTTSLNTTKNNPLYSDESLTSVYENLGERSITYSSINFKMH